MALDAVPPGKIAAIVTYLDMRAPPRPRPMHSAPLRLARWSPVPTAKYRALFRRVGGPWLWFSRLAMDDPQLAAILDDAGVEVFAAEDRAGIEVGMLELDFRQEGQCELSYFGLVTELAGQGYGGWLMAQALARAWRPGVRRVHVHTCTLDHPAALPFYLRSGFTARGRAVETFADPRLAGLLPRDVAPHVPLIEP